MNHSKQVEHFAEEIDRVINRFRMEYRLNICAAIGVLTLASHRLMSEALENDDEPEENVEETSQ